MDIALLRTFLEVARTRHFGNAANNGRMLGEMDAQNPIVGSIREIAHVLTGRAEAKTKKPAGLSAILDRLKLKK